MTFRAAALDREEMSAAVAAVRAAARLDRELVRQEAVNRCSESMMVQGYEQVYRDAVRNWDHP